MQVESPYDVTNKTKELSMDGVDVDPRTENVQMNNAQYVKEEGVLSGKFAGGLLLGKTRSFDFN